MSKFSPACSLNVFMLKETREEEVLCLNGLKNNCQVVVLIDV